MSIPWNKIVSSPRIAALKRQSNWIGLHVGLSGKCRIVHDSIGMKRHENMHGGAAGKCAVKPNSTFKQ